MKRVRTVIQRLIWRQVNFMINRSDELDHS